jgi:hypothetical protein
VPTVTPTGKADVAYHAHETTARNENPIGMSPNFIKLIVELLIVADEAKLAVVCGILLESPVWREVSTRWTDSSAIQSN